MQRSSQIKRAPYESISLLNYMWLMPTFYGLQRHRRYRTGSDMPKRSCYFIGANFDTRQRGRDAHIDTESEHIGGEISAPSYSGLNMICKCTHVAAYHYLWGISCSSTQFGTSSFRRDDLNIKLW